MKKFLILSSFLVLVVVAILHAQQQEIKKGGGGGGGIVDTSVLTVGQYQQYQDTITHAGTVTLDFSTTNAHSLSITGNVTFATSNLATNRTCRVRIIGTSTNATPTFPAWHFIGGSPTQITASKWGILSLEAWGTADTDVLASFAEEQ